VAAVEVGIDGGQVWSRAELIGPRAPYSWTLWEYLWEVAEAGTYALLARAVSASGQVQPSQARSPGRRLSDPPQPAHQRSRSRPLARVTPTSAMWTRCSMT